MTTFDLSDLREQIEQILSDQSNEVFNRNDIENGVRQALAVYSSARPRQAIGTIELAADGREISLASLEDLINVVRVWLPYTATNPEYPPRWRTFEHWQDAGVLYLSDEETPASGQVARVFYTLRQTLSGLDSATSTTIALDDEFLLASGSAGYAVRSRSRKTTEIVTVGASAQVSDQLLKWSELVIKDFARALGLAVDSRRSESGPAEVVVKRLTRKKFYQSDWPDQQRGIPV